MGCRWREAIRRVEVRAPREAQRLDRAAGPIQDSDPAAADRARHSDLAAVDQARDMGPAPDLDRTLEMVCRGSSRPVRRPGEAARSAAPVRAWARRRGAGHRRPRLAVVDRLWA